MLGAARVGVTHGARREVLAAFDTPCDRRRRKFTRLLMRYGVRVQRSVFLLNASGLELGRLWAALERVSEPLEDRLLLAAVQPGAWWQVGDAPVLEVPLVASF
ncbi:CRISPR-associated endonuclease Cas2 [Deinococcus sp. JMULE3]|uniref:CRISPR-associated endonuclease Cas2 n=1 Tax=Deinococcus sp. JMULE3 TaxID=2518341 RepID=UPI0015755C0C